MRFLILIALYISSTFAYDLSNFNNFYLSTKISNVHFNSVGPSSELRFKRDNYKRSLEDPNKCINNCTEATNERFQDLNDTEDDEDRTRIFCKTMEPEKDCIKACPDSLLRNLFLNFYDPLRMLNCSFGTYDLAEVQVNIDCLASSEKAVHEKCDTICSMQGKQYNINVNVNVAPPYVSYNNNKTQNTEMLQELCKGTKCFMACGESMRRAKCGQKALDFEKNNLHVIGYLIKMYKDLDALDGDMNECSDYIV